MRMQELRMERLARAQGNSVLRYVFDAPRRPSCSERALALARDIFRARQDLAGVCDAEARERLVRGESVFGWFRESFPKTFELITQADGGARHFDTLVELAAVRRQVEGGKSQHEADVHVQELLLARCALGAAPARPRE